VSGVQLDAGQGLEGINPAGQATNRVGGGLGNSGTQAIPGGVFMSPAIVQPQN